MFLGNLDIGEVRPTDPVTVDMLRALIQHFGSAFRNPGGAPTALEHVSFFNKVTGKKILKGAANTFVTRTGDATALVFLKDTDLVTDDGESDSPSSTSKPSRVDITVKIANSDGSSTQTKTVTAPAAAIPNHFVANAFAHVEGTAANPTLQVRVLLVRDGGSAARWVELAAVAF